MSFNSNLFNISNLLKSHDKKNPQGIFRITVVSFEDRCNINCGFRFAELLKKNNLFDVNFFNEKFPKGFLNLQGRNFFDFIDRGQEIIRNTKSDIIIWGYEEGGKIRINFQLDNQYTIPKNLFFSLLDSIFIPLNYFSDPENFSESLMLLIYGIIIAAINPVTNEQKINKPKILQNILNLLSNDSSQQDIPREFMPYIMNMLGKIYLSNVSANLTEKDICICQNLFENSLKNKNLMRLPVYYACIYNNLGQLFEIASNSVKTDAFSYIKQSISAYREAQKFLNRNYPYDYGIIAYHLSLLYFEFWKYTSDIQALRDAVSQLREAEKVYTITQFPHSWCHIEGLLGYYLTSLGMSTNSNEILLLAINSYKNQQKFFEQYAFPVEWAKIQEHIGHIYYLLGKINSDEKFMLEARNYFLSALDIYKNLNIKNLMADIEKRLLKIKDYIS